MSDKQTPYYALEEIHPWLFSLFDPLGAYCYLVLGSARAVLFDTGYGLGPLRNTVDEKCTSYEVILSHGHYDHVGGHAQFPHAHIHKADRTLALRHASRTARRRTMALADEKPTAVPHGFNKSEFAERETQDNFSVLDFERVFDLGDLTVHVVDMAGHTSGSIGLFIAEKRVLLAGDGISGSAEPVGWVFLPESLGTCKYIEMLNRLMKIDFATYFDAHNNAPQDKSFIHKYIKAAQNVSYEKTTPFDRLPEFGGRVYCEDGVSIIVGTPNQQTA